MTPDEDTNNLYNVAAEFLVDNQSSKTFEPIEFSRVANERGYDLQAPKVGGEEAGLTYQIKGEIDSNAPYAKETNIIYVSANKGEDEATYGIPVKDYKFDGEIYLRFGPGEYEVSVYAPDFEGTFRSLHQIQWRSQVQFTRDG